MKKEQMFVNLSKAQQPRDFASHSPILSTELSTAFVDKKYLACVTVAYASLWRSGLKQPG
jgi:hypothetical protein